MGNQLSDESKGFGRKGSLGLQKSELDKRCQASGLYPSCHWDDRAIRRLIGDGRIAARIEGSDTRQNVNDQECPICFLYYSQINITQCCKATICTECFLQVKPQKEKHSICPFCNCSKMNVTVAEKLGADEIEERDTNEQIMIEAKIKARVQGEETTLKATEASGKIESDKEFGSHLHDDAILQSRSSSSRAIATAAAVAGGGGGGDDEIQMLRKLSLSSADRQVLEREMKAQHTHPLTLRMQAEAEERRIANEREFNRKNPQRRRSESSSSAMLHAARRISNNNYGSYRNRFGRMNSEYARYNNNIYRGGGGNNNNRSWFEMMDAFDRGGGGGGGNNNRDDDMVVLEAAILLSMEEEARRRNNNNNNNRTNNNNNSLPFMNQFGAAKAPSSFAVDNPGRRGLNRIVSLPPIMPSSSPSSSSVTNNNSLESLSRTLTEEEQIAMAIALSMQESEATKKNEKEQDDSGEKKESSGNDDEGCNISNASAVVAVASLPQESSPSSSGVASLLLSSSNNNNNNNFNDQIIMEDDEEEIVFSHAEQKLSPWEGKMNNNDNEKKWSADDDNQGDNYLGDILLDKEEKEHKKIPDIGNLKQDC